MGLRISGKNLDIGEAIRTQAEDRVGSALGKYYEGTFNGHVTMAKDGTGFRSDAVLHLSSGMTLEASGMAHDAYLSLDKMVDKIEKRLRRYKRRLKDHSGNAHARRALMDIPSYVIEAPNEDAEEDLSVEVTGTHPVIVAETTRELHDLSVGNAVSELDLTGSPVLVFRNAGNGRVNIVYRRRDGNIGWIDPPTSLS